MCVDDSSRIASRSIIESGKGTPPRHARMRACRRRTSLREDSFAPSSSTKSSTASRSRSGTSAAFGLPCEVKITRSWLFATASTKAEKSARASAMLARLMYILYIIRPGQDRPMGMSYRDRSMQNRALDRFLPDYHFVERHAIRVRAPAYVVYRATREVTAAEMPLVPLLF